MTTILINTKTNKQINIDDIVTDFRGDLCKVTALCPNDGMNGKVGLDGALYYPSVVSSKFIEIE